MVMNRAGIIDITASGKLDVKGPDAIKFMDTISASNVPEVGILSTSISVVYVSMIALHWTLLYPSTFCLCYSWERWQPVIC